MEDINVGDFAREKSATAGSALVVEVRHAVPSVRLWHNDGSQSEWDPKDLVVVEKRWGAAPGVPMITLDNGILDAQTITDAINAVADLEGGSVRALVHRLEGLRLKMRTAVAEARGERVS